jgi:hypothetical protein
MCQARSSASQDGRAATEPLQETEPRTHFPSEGAYTRRALVNHQLQLRTIAPSGARTESHRHRRLKNRCSALELWPQAPVFHGVRSHHRAVFRSCQDPGMLRNLPEGYRTVGWK